jgi:Fur family ferric uptake transcriptional regulator
MGLHGIKRHIEYGYQNQRRMKKNAIQQLSDYLAGQGLKSTRQRDRIFEVFVSAGRHLSAEELYLLIKKTDRGIGYATVYRTLKLLTLAGLAHERRFEDGITRFEHNAAEGHHDHLICTRCGRIIEFENEQIETLQLGVAKKNKFQVHSHKLELYGLCEGCQKKVRVDG